MLWEWIAAAVCLVILRCLYEFLMRRPMLPAITDKYVLVTGCDSGFGKALAQRLDVMGCRVLAGCLTQQGADQLSHSCSSRLVAFLLDVSKEESVTAAVSFATSRIPDGQGLHGLVNNAGIQGYFFIPSPEFHTRRDFQHVLDVNLLGMADMTLQLLPLLKQGRGRIVNTASVSGRLSAPLNWPYPASKFAVEALSDSERVFLQQYGIKVSVIEPGLFATNIMTPDQLRQKAEEGLRRVSKEYKASLGDDYIDRVYEFGMLMADTAACKDLSAVVDAYVHALFALHPKKRYAVGWDARLFYIPFSYMPSCIQDAFGRWIVRRLPGSQRRPIK